MADLKTLFDQLSKLSPEEAKQLQEQLQAKKAEAEAKVAKKAPEAVPPAEES